MKNLMQKNSLLALSLATSVVLLSGCTSLENNTHINLSNVDVEKYQALPPVEKEQVTQAIKVNSAKNLHEEYGNVLLPYSKVIAIDSLRKGESNARQIIEICRMADGAPLMNPSKENLGVMEEGKFGYVTIVKTTVLHKSAPIESGLFRVYYTDDRKFEALAKEYPENAKMCLKLMRDYHAETLKPSEADELDYYINFINSFDYYMQIAMASSKEKALAQVEKTLSKIQKVKEHTPAEPLDNTPTQLGIHGVEIEIDADAPVSKSNPEAEAEMQQIINDELAESADEANKDVVIPVAPLATDKKTTIDIQIEVPAPEDIPEQVDIY